MSRPLPGQVLLEPGDLLLLHGSARYKWEHGIEKCCKEEWGSFMLCLIPYIDTLHPHQAQHIIRSGIGGRRGNTIAVQQAVPED